MLLKSSGDFKMRKELGVFLLAILVSLFGLFYLSSNGRSTPLNYLVGDIIAEDKENLTIKIDYENSNLATPFSERIYSVNKADIGTYFTEPDIGKTVRITCNKDMSVLIAIYDESKIQDDNNAHAD